MTGVRSSAGSVVLNLLNLPDLCPTLGRRVADDAEHASGQLAGLAEGAGTDGSDDGHAALCGLRVGHDEGRDVLDVAFVVLCPLAGLFGRYEFTVGAEIVSLVVDHFEGRECNKRLADEAVGGSGF